MADKGCPDRQAGNEEEDLCHLCETSKEDCLLNLQETSSERERKTEKNVYGVKEASLLVSVSFIFLYFTLCQCLCISF